jgi:4Fe-4S ferredoxin
MISVVRDGKDKRELKHNNDLCVGCGLCSETCPTKALSLGPVLPIARGLISKDYINMKEDNCVLCGLCSFSCPFNALDFKIDGVSSKSLMQYPKWEHKVDYSEHECIFCGKCEVYCPREAISVKRELPKIEDLVRGEVITDVDKCINCKICVELCPNDAITIVTNPDSNAERFDAVDIQVDKSKCIYCKVCTKVCPENAIRAICTTCMDSDEIAPVKIKGNFLLDEDSCVNCGWCGKVCPTDAIKVNKPFEGEILLTEDEEHVCKGSSCHACIDVCPCNAVKFEDDKAVFNNDFCILCGACSKVCPQKVIKINRTSINLNNIKSTSWQKILDMLIA